MRNQHGSLARALWAEVLSSTLATVRGKPIECSWLSVNIYAVQRVTAIGKPPEGKICSFAGLKNVVVFASKGRLTPDQAFIFYDLCFRTPTAAILPRRRGPGWVGQLVLLLGTNADTNLLGILTSSYSTPSCWHPNGSTLRPTPPLNPKN